jgi:cystathionine gamma-lyase
MRRGSRYVHAGSESDPETGAVVPPIHTSTTFEQERPGEHRGYEYARTDNPTRARLESALAEVEGGEDAAAYASGMAACMALCHLLESGDRVVAEEDCYGGTRRYLTNNLVPFGVEVDFADLADPDAAEAALADGADLVLAETPTNPLLKLVDVERVAEQAERAGAMLCIDNTFASPHLQQPLELGADVVWHSATKYLGGHSDVVGGALVWEDRSLTEPMRFNQNSIGPVPGPFDCYQVLRGLKTLGVRMDRHGENARAVAEHAVDRDDVARVLFPGLPDHPGHDLAADQMDGFGGMVSLEVPGGMDGANAFFEALDVFRCAESLGAVESLANHPAEMTHASVPADVRRELGITDGLVRLSVGIEDAADLIEDLDQALDAAASTA